jgi:hypothetical protein
MLWLYLTLTTPFIRNEEASSTGAGPAASTTATTKQFSGAVLVDVDDLLDRQLADACGKNDEAAG